jgi:hypothetical protein
MGAGYRFREEITRELEDYDLTMTTKMSPQQIKITKM